MADEGLNDMGAGREWISDKTLQGETFRRKRSIDSTTGALTTCEEYPAKGLSIRTDQLAGKVRKYYQSRAGNYYEILDTVHDYQREVDVSEKTLGVAMLHLTEQLSSISINYNEKGKWRGLWIEVEPHQGSNLESLSDEDRAEALFNRTPKDNLNDFLSFYDMYGRKAFLASLHEDGELASEEVTEGVEEMLANNFRRSRYKHLIKAEQDQLVTEVTEGIDDIAEVILEKPLEEGQLTEEFKRFLTTRILITPDLPENILSLPPEEKMISYATAFYSAIIWMLSLRYSQLAEAGNYTVGIISSEEDNNAVTINLDGEYQEKYKLGEKMRKEEYVYTLTQTATAVVLDIKNLLKSQTIQVKFPPNGANFQQVREIVENDHWTEYSDFVLTEVVV